MDKSFYNDINTLSRFCAPRDIPCLTQKEVEKVLGEPQADVMVLFGGNILAGGDVFADAIWNKVARKYIIVGGAGHTTQTLRDKVHALYPDFDTDGLPEAVVFAEALKRKYALSADYLETVSTNCGNNITNLLQLIKTNNLVCRSIILCQDATMQRRMSLTLRKYEPEMKIINFAGYEAVLNEDLSFTEEIRGMWDLERYVSLLMGEISRITDDKNGYGPAGKGFIVHEDIPQEVQQAFIRLKNQDENMVRKAYAAN
ncbi:MAG: YdcF family protein [Eubacteriales bacterium]|nr:YdcF family protein [Eubacteriales bacterium]